MVIKKLWHLMDEVEIEREFEKNIWRISRSTISSRFLRRLRRAIEGYFKTSKKTDVNKTLLSSLIVQEYFGGHLLLKERGNKKVYFNKLITGEIISIMENNPTKQKTGYVIVNRENILRNLRVKNDYELLKHYVTNSLSKKWYYLTNPTADRLRIKKEEKTMEKELNIELHNPFYDGNVEFTKEMDRGEKIIYNKKTSKIIVEEDLKDVEMCDGIIAIVNNKSSAGSFMEIFFNSYYLHRPTYLIIEEPYIRDHPWIVYLATKVFKSIDEFKEWYKKENKIKS